MIKVEYIDTWGFRHAIRGMRNPKNSWDKSDSYYVAQNISEDSYPIWEFEIGKNDRTLMQKLYNISVLQDNHAHRKYLRQIFVSMDIIAPLYWWKEFDTYKVGTVSNSCSTMHKIHAKEFELDDFSHEHLSSMGLDVLGFVIDRLNTARQFYIGLYDFKADDDGPDSKDYWWEMIQLLPSSYNQRRTITMNYENVVTIICQRANHKLNEWREFVNILSKLPHLDEIVGE